MKSEGIFCKDPPGKNIGGIRNPEKIIEFFLFGIVSSVIDISLLLVFTEGIGIWYLYSAVLSYGCGILVSDILNKYLNFRDGSRHYILQFTSFAAVSFSCFLVNISLIWLAVELFSLDYLTAKLIATLCSFLWNYYGQSRITFRIVK